MLEPYSVLDCTDHRGEIGPMVLGDLGADVIKVEPPGGSSARQAVPLAADNPDGMQSLQFLAFNRNKRSICLDPGSDADREALAELVRRTTFLIDSAPGSLLDDFGLDVEALQALNPRLVHVRVSAFGADGPHANYVANDLVIAAMGGPVSLQGAADRAPVRVTVPQAWRHAGVEAAAGALVAHGRMLRTGTAQYVDLSAQAAMTWTMLNGMTAQPTQGFEFERGGSGVGGPVKVEIVHPTKDGYIVALPMSAVLQGCTEWMIEDGVVDATWRDIDWQNFDMNARDPESQPLNLAEATRLAREFLAKHTKQELYDFGLEHRITLAPVNDLSELLALEHLETRDYWRAIDGPGDTDLMAPGIWARSPQSPVTVRRETPRPDEHGAEIRAALSQPAPEQSWPTPEPDKLPFDGVKVCDFAWVGVGPISSKYLADHGAHVVRIESEGRPDVLRGGPPFQDNEPGINRSQFYGNFNTSKQSIALDMKHADANDIALQLITWADVMIESFAPGAIGRMGLGYEEVRKHNPGLIMVSTCLMGQTGPASLMAGYGYHAAALAGFYETTGWPDMAPNGPWVAYTDTIAPRFISTLLAAALDHKRRTGQGCYLDVAQLETALHFLAPEIFDLQVNGYSATRLGNRSPHAAPQSCYPCSGDDQWCAVSIDTDAEWRALCGAIGQNELADRYPSNEARLAAHDAIDAVLSEWTATRSRDEVTRTLQAAGVPAGPVQQSGDLVTDPQYKHRGFIKVMDHPETGPTTYAGHQYSISTYDNGPRGPAPTLGQHSFEVLTEILGFSDEAVGNAFASGVIN